MASFGAKMARVGRIGLATGAAVLTSDSQWLKVGLKGLTIITIR